MSDDIRDLIIIGSGPAGYTAAIYAARANLTPLVFEGSVTAGGALMTTTDVENFPGFPDGIMGPDADGQPPQRRPSGSAPSSSPTTSTDVDLDGRHQDRQRLADGNTYQASAVMLAMGSGYRKLEIDGEDRLSGHGVSWCATCDGFFFREQHIVGGRRRRLRRRGGDVPDPVRLQGHAGPPPRRAARLQDHAGPRVRQRQDRVRLEHEVAELLGDDKLEGVIAARHRDRRDPPARRHRPVHRDRPRPALGARQGPGRARRRGLRPRAARQHAPPTCSGVFAAGDLVDHIYRQAVTAAGTGCAAALDAERFLADLEHAGAPRLDAALIDD